MQTEAEQERVEKQITDGGTAWLAISAAERIEVMTIYREVQKAGYLLVAFSSQDRFKQRFDALPSPMQEETRLCFREFQNCRWKIREVPEISPDFPPEAGRAVMAGRNKQETENRPGSYRMQPSNRRSQPR